MLNHNLIMMNRFCNDLHNDENIIFCKRDFILQEYERIKQKKNNLVLIICNSDYTFDDNLLNLCPPNVKHIFSTNTTCISEKVTPIPIGVEMEIKAVRKGHGEINETIFEKLPFLLGEKKVTPELVRKTKILSNFSLHTNFHFRDNIRQISSSLDFYEHKENIPFEEFVKGVKQTIGTLSPRGNGIECIRTYETLYLGGIPIVIGDYKEYESILNGIYKKLPIVFISDLEKLKDFKYIESQINYVKNNSLELLSYDYWKNLIEQRSLKLT